MDYARPALADRLAAAYVLGTLAGPARRRFEALLPSHPALRTAVAGWESRLMPLALSVQPVEPPAQVWAGIEGRLFGSADGAPAAAASRRASEQGWWRRLGLWQALSGLATTAALAMAVLVTQVPPAQPPVVVVLGANPEAAAALEASFVASVSADGRALVLRPLNPLRVSADRALQLWAVPAAGAPRPLGLVRTEGETRVLRAELLRDTAAFAVSVEPPGGSPTGAPTGPIVSVGKLQI